MQEIWKDVKGYERSYEVSNLGNVRKKGKQTNRVLIPTKHGYPQVTLSANGFLKTVYVHRLVAEAFIPNPNELPCVNHIDCNPSNNNVENLEWVTYSENTKHAIKNNKFTPSFCLESSLEAMQKGREMRKRSVMGLGVNGETVFYEQIIDVKKDGFDSGNVIKCCQGKRKSHKGYMWKYAD